MCPYGNIKPKHELNSPCCALLHGMQFYNAGNAVNSSRSGLDTCPPQRFVRLQVINKATIHFLPLPSFVLICQLVAATAIVWLGGKLRVMEVTAR